MMRKLRCGGKILALLCLLPLPAWPVAPPEMPAAAALPTIDKPALFARLDPSHRNVHPDYPMASVAAREQGTTVLRIRVDATGYVAEALVETSSGSRRLDQAAINGVRAKGTKEWRFLPAQVDSKPIDTWQLVGIKWKLDDASDFAVSEKVAKPMLAAQRAIAAGDYEAALAACESGKRFAKSTYEQFVVSVSFGQLYLRQKNYGLAADTFEISMTLDALGVARDEQLLARICQLRFAAKDYVVAVAACQRAVKQTGPSVKLSTLIVLSYQQLGRYAEAVDAGNAAMALTLPNDDAEGLLKLQFNNYQELRDLAGQRKTLERLIAIKPSADYADRLAELNRKPQGH